MSRSIATREMVEIVGAPSSGAKSGQKTVTTAGTAVALATTREVNCGIVIRALAANTGKIYVGNDGAGDVTSANGFELAAGDLMVIDYVEDIADIIIDSSVNGEGVSWYLNYF